MKLTIVTPEKKVLDSVTVQELLVPGAKGEIGILPGHAPLVSTLGTGVLKYRLPKEKTFKQMAVSWGYCEVQADKVVVLAESVETKKELDKHKTTETLKDILKQLENIHLSPEEIRKLRKKEEEQRTFLKLLD
ncbi:MAG: ATP synthase F1 subunit epsilon [Bdellovibrionales bacterium]|nr:ATP synthase F1 subunit epsilon [Bdellovibrionales bacterium]